MSTGAELAQAFREEGAECLHLYEPEHLPAYDADDVSPHTFLHRDREDTLRLLRQVGATAVIAASEFGVTLADTLAAALGLDHHRRELIGARRDKQLMVRALEAAGVPTARTVPVRSEAALRRALAAWTGGFPVMVKPRNSAGSDGCRICRTPEEALAAFGAIADEWNLMGERNDEVLLQEFLAGTQYIVNTVSRSGRHLLSEVYRERIDHVDGAPVLRHIISRPTPTAEEDGLVAYVLDCLDALGIREGAAHTEVMLTPAGPRLIEVNSRVMGPSLSPDPYFAGFGYSQQHLVVERYLRPEAFAARFEVPYAPERIVAKAFLRPHGDGVLQAVDGLRTLRRLPGFHSLDKMPAVGEPVRDRYLTTAASGIAFFVHDDAEVLDASLAALHALEDSGALFRLRPEPSLVAQGVN
ncbi:ATP-grasp domain-containing protein [Streptacidiphilus rugosus]|uniref:ATP-grasp domain-containing protein n=1 Tax=Streptacidiphilus rugosus TaxID=405783 RepID=UPI00068F3FA3|nr:ATP-grasp domain-containing protein [Streptacidiphilus rugosus]